MNQTNKLIGGSKIHQTQLLTFPSAFKKVGERKYFYDTKIKVDYKDHYKLSLFTNTDI